MAQGVGFEPTRACAQTVFKFFRFLSVPSRIVLEYSQKCGFFATKEGLYTGFFRKLRENCETKCDFFKIDFGISEAA